MVVQRPIPIPTCLIHGRMNTFCGLGLEVRWWPLTWMVARYNHRYVLVEWNLPRGKLTIFILMAEVKLQGWGHYRPLFVYNHFKQGYNFYYKLMWFYLTLRFELITAQLRVSSHNHWTITSEARLLYHKTFLPSCWRYKTFWEEIQKI